MHALAARRLVGQPPPVPSPTLPPPPRALQVLKNPSVPFQEGPSVLPDQLSARGVKPYGPPVDVWAAGVLAYELVGGGVKGWCTECSWCGVCICI